MAGADRVFVKIRPGKGPEMRIHLLRALLGNGVD
jgi:hypothetical protein